MSNEFLNLNVNQNQNLNFCLNFEPFGDVNIVKHIKNFTYIKDAYKFISDNFPTAILNLTESNNSVIIFTVNEKEISNYFTEKSSAGYLVLNSLK